MGIWHHFDDLRLQAVGLPAFERSRRLNRGDEDGRLSPPQPRARLVGDHILGRQDQRHDLVVLRLRDARDRETNHVLEDNLRRLGRWDRHVTSLTY